MPEASPSIVISQWRGLVAVMMLIAKALRERDLARGVGQADAAAIGEESDRSDHRPIG